MQPNRRLGKLYTADKTKQIRKKGRRKMCMLIYQREQLRWPRIACLGNRNGRNAIARASPERLFREPASRKSSGSALATAISSSSSIGVWENPKLRQRVAISKSSSFFVRQNSFWSFRSVGSLSRSSFANGVVSMVWYVVSSLTRVGVQAFSFFFRTCADMVMVSFWYIVLEGLSGTHFNTHSNQILL